MIKIIKIITGKQKLTFSYPFKESKLPYQDSKRWWPHMPVDFIHPLMTDGTGWDDQSCSCWYWLHCNKTMGAVERLNLQILLFIIHTFCMLPQVAFQALNTRFMVYLVKFTAYALKAIIRGITGTHNISLWHITISRVYRFTLVLCSMFFLDFKDTCTFSSGNISNSRVTGSWTVILWIETDVKLTSSLFCG